MVDSCRCRLKLWSLIPQWGYPIDFWCFDLSAIHQKIEGLLDIQVLGKGSEDAVESDRLPTSIRIRAKQLAYKASSFQSITTTALLLTSYFTRGEVDH
jgi:hypothetical protein